MRFQLLSGAAALMFASACIARPVGEASPNQGARAELAVPAQPATKSASMSLRVFPVTAPERAMRISLVTRPPEAVRGNAAVLYLQSLEYLRGRLTGDDVERLDQLRLAPGDEAAIADMVRLMAAASFDRAFKTVELASRMESCEWETPIREQGVETTMPELGSIRILAKLLAVRARHQILQAHFDDAVVTMRTGFSLARGLAHGPTIIQGLVGSAVAAMMLDQVEFMMTQRSAPSLYWTLTELGDHAVDLSPALRSERAILDFEFPSLAAIDSGAIDAQASVAQLREMAPKLAALSAMSGGSVDDGMGSKVLAAANAARVFPKAKAYFIARGMTAEQIDALPVTYVSQRYNIAVALRWRDELYKWFALPYWQGSEGLHRTEGALRAAASQHEGEPFLAAFPTLEGVAWGVADVDRKLAMLRCIEAVRMYAAGHNGRAPTALSEIQDVPVPLDPVTGKAFEYRSDAAGFTLVGLPPAWADESKRIEVRVAVGG